MSRNNLIHRGPERHEEPAGTGCLVWLILMTIIALVIVFINTWN